MSNWAQSFRLTGNTPGIPASDSFGTSTSLNSVGNVLAVGAYLADTNSVAAGAVYIFTGRNNSWAQAVRLTGNSPGNPAEDIFGISTSLNSSGNILAVGAYFADTNLIGSAGAVYIFTGSNDSWAQAARLTGNTIGSPDSDFFGYSTSLNSSGNILAVGARNADTNLVGSAGAVYIFTGSNNSWAQAVRLTGNTIGDPASDFFGNSISLNSAGNILAVGAVNADTNNVSNAGAVYIFTGSNDSWAQAARLTGNTIGSPGGDFFGFSTSLNSAGNILAVGAYTADTNNVTGGAVYIFTGSNNSWAQAARLTGNTIGNPAEDTFGSSVSLNSIGNVLAVGAYNADTNNVTGGAVYIFTGSNNSWAQAVRLTGNSPGNPDVDRFGNSTSLNSSGNILAVGAYDADTNGVAAGAAYIFNGKLNQNITFPEISNKSFGDPVFFLSGFSDSNLPLSYSSSNALVASISGGSGVKINNLGSVTITATQTGDSFFEAATPTSRSFNVFCDYIQSISAGYDHSLALLKDGSVTGWGSNLSGQLSIPTGIGTGAASISAGAEHSLALLKDGRVTGWGSNLVGQINIPVGIGTNATGISAGGYFSLALLKNGSVTGWGFNTYGATTIPVGIGTNAAAIDAGGGHSLALLKDGRVTGWGGNDFGQLNIPGYIGYNATGIAAGGLHSLALLKDGSVTGWGFNDFGQLNIPVGIGTNAAAIAAAGFHSLALLKDGRVTGWGNNDNGQTTIPGYIGYNATGIFAGSFYSLALLKDGSVTGWGYNLSGQTNVPKSINCNLGKANQTITFPAIPTKTNIDASFNVNATSTNNTIPLSYSSSNTNVATISNNGTINIIAAGSSTITVSQPADSDYNAANSVTRNLLVLNSPSVRIANLSGSIANEFFGASVALNLIGNVLVVGSPFADISGNDVVVKAAGLSSAFVNVTGWKLYSTRSNFLSYEYLGTSVAINDTENVIALGAIGTTASNGNINAGNYYLSAREQTCPDIKLLNQNPIENYTIPNIKVQLDAMDSYSLNQDQTHITYWKNKVNFGKGYNNSYNDGDAITLNSDIRLIDIGASEFSGLLDYNDPKPGDYISFDNKKFIYPIDFSGITGLNNLINGNSAVINKINSKIINDTTLLLFSSGSNNDKTAASRSLIKTNYLSGSNQGVGLASYYSINTLEYLNFTKIANDVQNIYACRHSETGEIDSSYRRQINNININLENEYFLAILKNGKITGFGTNYSGRLLGTMETIGWDDSPVGKITGAVKLSLGSDFALALLNNKKITGWGNNFSGKATLGNNLTGVIDISAGGNHSLALLDDGRVTGWGDNTYDQALRGNTLSSMSAISAGWLHSLALGNNGRVTGWGYNEYGQATLGNSITTAKEISAGKFHSLAILNNRNRITGWGDDYFNQISDIHKNIYSYKTKFSGITQAVSKGYDIFLLNSSGTATGLGNFSYYEQLQGIALTGITQISNSENHIMMVNNINKITGFGNNDYSQISSGFNLTGVSEVGAGTNFSIALLRNKKVTGWGLNTDNQAFGGNNLTGVKTISVGSYHTLAILNNNTLTGWGNNIYGQALDGNYLTGVSGISAGEFHSLALLNNGRVTGWGDDTYGQASSGNFLTRVVNISAGKIHSLALLDNGRITGWGDNQYADGGNNLTGVLKISAGFYNSTAILNDKNSVTGWGDINTLTDLYNITSTRSTGPTGLSGISAGLFSSYAYSGDNKKISNFGQKYLDIDSLPNVNLTTTQLQQLPKYNFAQGVNFAAFIIKNENSGSMNISKNNISSSFTQSGYNNVLPIEIYSFDNLKFGKYSYSITGSGFYNALEKYPDDDTLLPEYQTNVMLSAYFTNLSTMIITGYTGSLPISLFFVEYGLLNSHQKTIQSYSNTGCYISTLNTGKLINLTGIGNPIKVNEPFYSDIQVGNLIMNTGRFEYYINNRLIYTGSTGFNFGQILLGNNFQYTGTQAISTYTGYPENLQPTDLTGIEKGFNGNLFEVLIYNSALNELNRNEVFYYLANKWQTISNYYPSRTIDLTNRIVYNEKTKSNCNDCSSLLNSIPKENERHALLFEYNLYGYSGSIVEDCDIDMHVYILKTGFYEEARKEPLVTNLDIDYITGNQKSISTVNIKSQNVYNVADFNFDYNKILPSQRRLKVLESNIKLQQPKRMYLTGEYLKYPKIDGNGI